MLNKVSIIIPSYNVEKYIFRAIESSMKQTYKNIEIIIIDDGSSDSTWNVIQKYANLDNRIICIKQENQGVSVARNQGLEVSSGEYVIFLDSDDWLEENTIEFLVNRLDKTNKLIAANCFFAYFDSNNNIYKEKSFKEYIDIDIDRYESLKSFCLEKYRLSSSCYKLFSSKIIKNHNLRFEKNIHHGEDGMFVYNYLSVSDGLKYVTEPLWNILERPNSATTSPYNHSWISAVTAAEMMIDNNKLEDMLPFLKLYLIRRIGLVLHSALKISVNDITREDIVYLRKKLAENKKYIKMESTIKRRIYLFLLMIIPIKLLNKFFLKIKR